MTKKIFPHKFRPGSIISDDPLLPIGVVKGPVGVGRSPVSFGYSAEVKAPKLWERGEDKKTVTLWRKKGAVWSKFSLH